MDRPEPSSAESPPGADRVPLARLLGLFVLSRVLIFAVGAFSLFRLPKGPHFAELHGVADWFLRWDAHWYLDIIKNGYHHAPGDSNVGYFPLYPWIARGFTLGGWIEPRLAGYLASLVGLWLACLLLWRLVAREWGDPTRATLAVAFFLFNPVTVFFSSLYSESWFLPLTIGCFAAARARRWWLAGLLGALAAFTRFVGVALVVPLAWEWLTWLAAVRGQATPRIRPGEAVTRGKAVGAALACLLPLAGYGAYCAVMWVKFGNPFMYAEANAESGRHFTWFWGLFTRPSFTGLPLFYQAWFAGSVIVAFGLLLFGVWLRMPSSFVVYGLVFSFIYISARFADSMPRYFGGLFPMYIAVALVAARWPRLIVPLLASGIALQILSVILFVNGYWYT